MRRKRKCGQILAAAFLAAAMALPVSASGETGSVRVALRDLGTGSSIREGVEFHLWKVGTVTEDSVPVIDEAYGIPEYPGTGQEVEEALEQIQDLLQGEPEQTGRTGPDGVLSFEAVEPGVYLLEAGEENPYGVIAPALIHLPYWEEVQGELEGPVYEVTIEPKASPYPEKPETESVPTDAPETDITEDTAVQTGDWARAGLLGAGMAAAFFLAVTMALTRRRQESRRRNEG